MEPREQFLQIVNAMMEESDFVGKALIASMTGEVLVTSIADDGKLIVKRVDPFHPLTQEGQ